MVDRFGTDTNRLFIPVIKNWLPELFFGMQVSICTDESWKDETKDMNKGDE